MKTALSINPSEFETDCLAVLVLDRSEKDASGNGRSDAKPVVTVETSDAAVRDAAASVLAGSEVTAKMFETTLVHAPAKLKAKRLLLVGGGKAKTFSSADLRRVAGTAARTLKSKGIRSFALLHPPT